VKLWGKDILFSKWIFLILTIVQKSDIKVCFLLIGKNGV